MNKNLEKIGCFSTVFDSYNGLIIESSNLPKTKEEFEKNLDILIDEVKDKKV